VDLRGSSFSLGPSRSGLAREPVRPVPLVTFSPIRGGAREVDLMSAAFSHAAPSWAATGPP